MKKTITIVTVVMIMIICVMNTYAETVTAWSTLSPTNGTVTTLLDIMRNDEEYDPYNEYEAVRISETQYVLYFGSKLQGENVVKYIYTTGTYGTIPTLTRVKTRDVHINRQGYFTVGNTQGAQASEKVETYKYQYVVIAIGFVLIIYVMIRHHKKTEGTRIQYYKVRG